MLKSEIESEIKKVFVAMCGDTSSLELSSVLKSYNQPHFCVWYAYNGHTSKAYTVIYDAKFIDVFEHVASRCVLDNEGYTMINGVRSE